MIPASSLASLPDPNSGFSIVWAEGSIERHGGTHNGFRPVCLCRISAI